MAKQNKNSEKMEVNRSWLDWLASGDTGISSETMFSAITGIPVSRYDVPKDIADIGRCVRMLRKLPDLRTQLHKVIEKHKEWMPYIDCWRELESRYDECQGWDKLTEVQQKRMRLLKRNFKNPNQQADELLKKLQYASYYLQGMRIQNFSHSWTNRAPKNY